MKIDINEIAQFIGAEIKGNTKLQISKIASIDEAVEGDLTFLYSDSYKKHLNTTNASAILIKPGIEQINPDLTYLEVDAPQENLLKIILKYFNPEFPLKGIDKSASIDPLAELGENVSIGKNVVIEAGCIIGDNTKVFHNTVILKNNKIGSDCLLHPNLTIRENCVIGCNVIIHSGSVIGSDGFGYIHNKFGKYDKIPQIGNVVIEDNVEIGSNVSIDRAALGSTIIKKGSKIDNLVQVAHNVVIGTNTVISAQTGISGSTSIGNNCIVAGQVGLAGHIQITDGVILAAQSGVSKSIKQPGMYFGYPAKEAGKARRIEAHVRNLPDYAAKIKQLEKEINELKENLKD